MVVRRVVPKVVGSQSAASAATALAAGTVLLERFKGIEKYMNNLHKMLICLAEGRDLCSGIFINLKIK